MTSDCSSAVQSAATEPYGSPVQPATIGLSPIGKFPVKLCHAHGSGSLLWPLEPGAFPIETNRSLALHWVVKPMTGVFITRPREHTGDMKRRTPCKYEAKDWSDATTNQGLPRNASNLRT